MAFETETNAPATIHEEPAAEAFAQESAATQDALPDDIEATLQHKRKAALGVISAFAGASAVASTLPLPIKDAVMLSPLELAEINALADVYGIPKEGSARKILGAIAELGLLSVLARGSVRIVERGIRLKAASALKSALIASSIVAVMGASAAYAFEQVLRGELEADELSLAARLSKSGQLDRIMSRAQSLAHNVTGNVEGTMRTKLGDDVTEGLKASAKELFNTVVAQG